MILKSKVPGFPFPATYFHIVLNKDAIVQDRISAPTNIFTILIHDGCMHDHVICLPDTRCPTGIYQWRIPIINGTRLSMGIG